VIGDAVRPESAAILEECDRLGYWLRRIEERGGLCLAGEPDAFLAALAAIESRRKVASAQVVAGPAGRVQ
jgi:hypothetical protein